MAGQPLDMTDYISSKSDHFTVEDFIGGPRVFTIRGVDETHDEDRPIALLLEGEDMAYLPSKTCRRILARVWPEASKAMRANYPGRSLRLFLDPDVTFGNDKVGGIRIDGATHIDATVSGKLPAGRNKRVPFRVDPIQAPTSPPSLIMSRVEKGEAMIRKIDRYRLEELRDRFGFGTTLERESEATLSSYLRALADLHGSLTQGEE